MMRSSPLALLIFIRCVLNHKAALAIPLQHYTYRAHPTSSPTSSPSYQPSSRPSTQPTSYPSSSPSSRPSSQPSSQPSNQPSFLPSSQPSLQPSSQPSSNPSSSPSYQPSLSVQPSSQPSSSPSSSSFLRTSNSLTNRQSSSSFGFKLTVSLIGVLLFFIGIQVGRKSLAGNQKSLDEVLDEQNDTLEDIDKIIAGSLESLFGMQEDPLPHDIPRVVSCDQNSVDESEEITIQASTQTHPKRKDKNKHKRREGGDEKSDRSRKHRHRDRRHDDGDDSRRDRRRDSYHDNDDDGLDEKQSHRRKDDDDDQTVEE